MRKLTFCILLILFLSLPIIDIYMNYVISTYKCRLVSEQTFTILPNVPYLIENATILTILGFNGELPVVLDLQQTANQGQINVSYINYKGNNYFYIDKACFSESKTIKINFKNKDYLITISSKLFVYVDGEVILDKKVENITYSHYQEFKNHLVVFFEDKAKFALIIKDGNVKCADFYDEINIDDNELYLMKRLHDSLNHGKVYCVNNEGYSDYLIYLDDNELNLKPELTAPVFLDLLKAGNFSYCNHLLAENLRPKESKDIAKFFPEFDMFLEVEDNVFCLIKNNTQAGIVKFEIDNLITNISLI